MIVYGTARSTKTWEHEGSGADAGAARAEAIRGVPDGFDLVDVQTLTAKPGEPVTMKAFARSTQSQPVEADGADEAAALTALRAAVPPGWLLLSVTVKTSNGTPDAG
jgi:hypothetical protein